MYGNINNKKKEREVFIGTNYYGRIIPSKKRREELCDLITNSNDFNLIRNEISKTYDSIEYPGDADSGNYGTVHLGKRSGGWKFLWNPNIYELRQGHTVKEETSPGVFHCNWVQDPSKAVLIYPLTKEGIKSFIDREDVEIYDEYGDKQDKEEFWKMALDWVTWKDNLTGKEQEAWDGKSYELYEQSRGNYNRYLGKNDYTYFLESLGCNIEWPYTDFYSDGLRFSTSNSFS